MLQRDSVKRKRFNHSKSPFVGETEKLSPTMAFLALIVCHIQDLKEETQSVPPIPVQQTK